MAEGEVNWMSTGIGLVLIGAAALYMNHHGDVHRDRYSSLQDCQRDWQQHARDCEQTRTGHGGFMFLGPRYEVGHRPQTPFSQLRSGTDVVARSGFGRSGARFGASS